MDIYLVVFCMVCCVFCFVIYLVNRKMIKRADEVLFHAYKVVSDMGDDLMNVRESLLRVKESMESMGDVASEKSD